MKRSFRKSFSFGRRKELHDDDPVNTRMDQNACSNSNSNLVKANQSKNFLRRARRHSSSPPPPSSSSSRKIKSKASEHPYNNHINDEDGDDDPFSPSANGKTRARPFDRLTNQIRKSFRNTLTRQRPRLESNNSNKRLILNTNDENRPVNLTDVPISIGLTSPIISLTGTGISDEKNETKTPPKRRKAPLAPTHLNQSVSIPNSDCYSLRVSDLHESGYVSSSNEPAQDLLTKKNNLNRSFRSRISLLLKKRHAKQQQQLQTCIDEDTDHHQHDDQDELTNKKLTLGQRFDTLRRSLQLRNRKSTSRGKRYLLSNE